MKPVLEDVFREKEYVIKAGKYELPYFQSPFHYHPEYEITCILKSEGTMYIGDKTFPFEKEELTFIGPSIPHVWINSKEYYKQNKKASAIVVQFSKNLFSDESLKTPEFSSLAKILNMANKGLKVKSLTVHTLRLLHELCKTDVVKRYAVLVQLLMNLASVNRYELLLHEQEVLDCYVNEKYEKLLTYIYNNSTEVTLNMVSEYIGMNKSALCRYIKKHTNSTFSELVNLIKVKNACILLRETDLSIIHIAFDTGFSSTSYFIRVFKKIIGKSPGKYRNEYNLS